MGARLNQRFPKSGYTVWIRGGTFHLDNSHLTATNAPWAIVFSLIQCRVSYRAYPGERPVFDFSKVRPDGYRVTIAGSHTQSECFRVAGGNRNRFERLALHEGMGTGWDLTSGASHLVLNCDAYNELRRLQQSRSR